MSPEPTSLFDVAVIGGGPAGYSAAIRASQLGARVVLIERDRLGGACLNYACVPTKFLRYACEILRSIEKAPRYGITAELKSADWQGVQSRRRDLIATQGEGLKGLLTGYGIIIYYGEARLLPGKEVRVLSEQRETTCSASKIILATGSTPAALKISGAGEVLASRDLLQINSLPVSLAIIGGGPVGIELATIFSCFGVTVSIIEMMPRILPGEDAELVSLLERELIRRGIKLYTGSSARSIEKGAGCSRITISSQKGEHTIEVELVSLCVGQKPDIGETATPESGLLFERGAVRVDEHLYTGADGIYAAGDVTGKSLLAYVAITQGKIAAENAMGLNTVMEYDAIPHCVFSYPELAGVGLTEAEAVEKGYTIKVGRSPFSANSAATIYGERRGMVKVIAESGSSRLLGAHILGTEAPILIHEAALAVKTGASATDIQRTLHAHPNLAEALWEAALDTDGKAIGFKR